MNGWIETSIINGSTCFVKSSSYDNNRKQYFLGVDPKKIEEDGDLVLLCGGINRHLRDVFLIPWRPFFETLKSGKPINTYKPPREYWQYKFYLRDRSDKWIMLVQPTTQSSNLDITKWRYDVFDALGTLKAGA